MASAYAAYFTVFISGFSFEQRPIYLEDIGSFLLLLSRRRRRHCHDHYDRQRQNDQYKKQLHRLEKHLWLNLLIDKSEKNT